MVNHRRVHRVRRVLQGPLDHTVRHNNPTEPDGWTTGRVSPDDGIPWLTKYQGKDFTRKPWWSTVMKRIRKWLIRNNPE